MDFSSLLNQKLVYWPISSRDGFGKVTFADPQELDCRWEDKQVLFIDVNGNEIQSSSVVYLDTAIELGGYFWLGEETDLDSDHSDPYEIENTREIRGMNKSYGLDGSDFLLKVYL